MILWYIRNLLFSIKYKIGIAQPGKDFIEVPSACTCDNIVEDCVEDCRVRPFYHPDEL